MIFKCHAEKPMYDYEIQDIIRLHSMMRSLRVINTHKYMEARIIRKQLVTMLHQM